MIRGYIALALLACSGCRDILGIGDRSPQPVGAIDAPGSNDAPVIDAASLCRAPSPVGQQPGVGGSPAFTVVSGGITVPALTAGFTQGVAFDLDHDQDSDLFVLDTDFSPSRHPAHLVIWRDVGGMYVDATSLLGTEPSLREPSEAVAIDSNGDGRDDVFVGQAGEMPSPPMFMFVQQGDSTMVERSSSVLVPETPTGGYFAMGAVAADVNCDGAMDLLQTQPYGRPVLRINDGQGSLVETSVLPTSADPLAANAFCDVDRDGDPDLFIGGCGSGCGDQPDALFLNDGFARFHAAAPGAVPVRSSAYGASSAACVDVDLDGWPDLLVADSHPADFVLVLNYLHNRGDGTFELSTANIAQPWGTTMNFLPKVKIADFNHDGWPDALISGSRVDVLVNQGGSLANGPALNGSVAFVVQSDLDGKPDVVTVSGSGAGFQAILYRNTTP